MQGAGAPAVLEGGPTFLDPVLRASSDLSSANSINLGRLLPQAVYYAASSLALWRTSGEAPSYIIPSGNLGNAVACVRSQGDPARRAVKRWGAAPERPDLRATCRRSCIRG